MNDTTALMYLKSYRLAVGVFACALLCYFFLDAPVAIWVQYHVTYRVDRMVRLISQLGYSAPYLIILPALLLYYTKIKHNDRLLTIVQLFTLAIAAPGLLVFILKIILGRARPALLYTDQIYGFFGMQSDAIFWSFPSGHSATVASICTLLVLQFPRYVRWFFSIGFFISFMRVLHKAHFISDVIVGFYLGCICTVFLYEIYYRLRKSPPILEPS